MTVDVKYLTPAPPVSWAIELTIDTDLTEVRDWLAERFPGTVFTIVNDGTLIQWQASPFSGPTQVGAGYTLEGQPQSVWPGYSGDTVANRVNRGEVQEVPAPLGNYAVTAFTPGG